MTLDDLKHIPELSQILRSDTVKETSIPSGSRVFGGAKTNTLRAGVGMESSNPVVARGFAPITAGNRNPVFRDGDEFHSRSTLPDPNIAGGKSCEIPVQRQPLFRETDQPMKPAPNKIPFEPQKQAENPGSKSLFWTLGSCQNAKSSSHESGETENRGVSWKTTQQNMPG